MILALVVIIFGLALVYTWSNGFQHASAVAASPFGSHALEKNQAIVLIFFFEVIGTIFGGSAVAKVVQSLSSWPEEPSVLPLLASALLSATLWNFLARRIKVPASSTHALIGGVIGALFAGENSFAHVQVGNFDPIHPSGVIGAVISLFLSPMLGFILSYVVYSILLIVCMRATSKLAKFFSHVQWISVAALAFGDGQNDTQKTMGLLVLAFQAAGLMHQDQIPVWLRIVIGLTMGIGAFSINKGLVKELAFEVYDLKPVHAFTAELSSASVLITNSLVGGPVSASQVIATSIMGTAAAERQKGIHWLIVKDIIMSWLITIPATGLLAALLQYTIFQWFGRCLPH
jgi:PiT family inorganic phosphate transporter